MNKDTLYFVNNVFDLKQFICNYEQRTSETNLIIQQSLNLQFTTQSTEKVAELIKIKVHRSSHQKIVVIKLRIFI